LSTEQRRTVSYLCCILTALQLVLSQNHAIPWRIV
jgi:hypothetical protein